MDWLFIISPPATTSLHEELINFTVIYISVLTYC